MKQKTKLLNISLFVAAFLFLFNPNFIVIDILPDCIGYVLLCAALSRLADLSETISEAVRLFRRMALLDCGKLLAIVWIYGFSGSDERSSAMLLWSFVFCVIELIFALPAYAKLFNGLNELGNFHANTAIHGFNPRRIGKKRRIGYTEKAMRFTFFFVILKSVLSFLPELSELANWTYDDSNALMNLYRYIGLFRFTAFVVVFVVGIIWLYKMFRYFARIKKDRELMAGLSNTYEAKILPKVGFFTEKYLRNGFLLLSIGFILTIDLRVDNIIDVVFERLSGIVNIIPDFLAGAALLVYVIYMRKRIMVNKKGMLAVSIAFFAVSLAVAFAELNFYTKHTFLSVLRTADGARDYWIMVAFAVASGILLWAFALLLAGELKHIIKEHTGFVEGREIRSEAEERQINDFHKELFRPVNHTLAALALYIASDVLNSLQVFCYAYYEADFGYFSAINLVCGLVFIGFAIKALSDIREAVKIKYMLE